MKNLKISTKLIVSFIITIALSVVIGIVGIYGITTMNNVSSDMYETKAKPLGDLTTATEYFQRTRVQSRNAIVYAGDSELLKSVESDFNQRMEQFVASMKAYEPSIVTETGRQMYNEIMDLYDTIYNPVVLEVIEGAKHGDSSVDLLAKLSTATDAANKIAENITQMIATRMNTMSDANEASNTQGQLLLVIIIVVIIVVAIVSVLLAIYVSGMISKPIIALTNFMNTAGSTGDIILKQEDIDVISKYSLYKDETGQCIGSTSKFVQHVTKISEELGSIAGGDLTVDVDLLSDRDVMGIALQKMVSNLNNMFNEINTSTSQVSDGSKQIADGAQSLAQGSTQQAAAVEQLSSSITEIAGKTKVNADMAGRAATLADSIKQSAEKGSRQMDQMMEAVKEINQASQSINKVIGVIDNIAFQTNILALNAAVEAARAGQHGKGFAVVAEEVRNLASKSAEAANETGALIANSMEKAELGARIADETAASLVEIVSGINESNQLVSEIARSSGEQSEGISQINKGIDQVAQVIQQNSATAEESAAASEEMSGQANMLEELISQFKLKDAGKRGVSLPQHSKPSRKQLVMPEKTSYSPSDISDFGKY